MNRRNMLRMLPVLPLVALPTSTQDKIQEIDTRISYRRADYRLWVIGGTNRVCETCTNIHIVYTHGCVPIAMPSHYEGPGHSIQVTGDAVPHPATQDCTVQHDLAGMPQHQHHNYRWT